ncbi:alpha/beta fold hydrolase [Micromonospora eburnea]|uniref:alpha/beta fold hydrolase n=1 Tax=Micromonospora eburnea TaxID=227316 RepID=UPI00364397C5
MTEIKAPTRVVAGGPASRLPQDRLAAMAARMPAGELATIDAGHAVPATRPTSSTRRYAPSSPDRLGVRQVVVSCSVLTTTCRKRS